MAKTPAPNPTEPDGEDAELLRLFAEFVPVAAEENRLCAIFGGLRSFDPRYAEAEMAFTVAGLKVSVRWDQIAAIPALTPEGIRAKAGHHDPSARFRPVHQRRRVLRTDGGLARAGHRGEAGMKPEPKCDIETLIQRLEGVAQILIALGKDTGSAPPATLLLLADVTKGIANGLMDRLDPESAL